MCCEYSHNDEAFILGVLENNTKSIFYIIVILHSLRSVFVVFLVGGLHCEYSHFIEIMKK